LKFAALLTHSSHHVRYSACDRVCSRRGPHGPRGRWPGQGLLRPGQGAARVGGDHPLPHYPSGRQDGGACSSPHPPCSRCANCASGAPPCPRLTLHPVGKGWVCGLRRRREAQAGWMHGNGRWSARRIQVPLMAGGSQQAQPRRANPRHFLAFGSAATASRRLPHRKGRRHGGVVYVSRPGGLSVSARCSGADLPSNWVVRPSHEADGRTLSPSESMWFERRGPDINASGARIRLFISAIGDAQVPGGEPAPPPLSAGTRCYLWLDLSRRCGFKARYDVPVDLGNGRCLDGGVTDHTDRVPPPYTLPSVLGLPTDSCSLLFLVKTRASALGSAVGAGGVWWSLAE
jgi:hypothetical protein